MGFSLLATLGLDVNPFLSGAGRAVGSARTAGREIGSAMGGALAGRFAQFATLGFAEEQARKIVEYGAHIVDVSRRLGIATDAAQQWDEALKLNGSSIESAAGFFEKLAIAKQKAVAGGEKEIGHFKALGVTLDDLRTKPVEQIALQIARLFQAGAPENLIADLRLVGGRAAGDLVAAFRAGLPEAVNALKDVGGVIDEEVLLKLKHASDEFKMFGFRMRAAFAEPVSELGAVLSGTERMITAIGGVMKTANLMGFVEGWKNFNINYVAQATALANAEERMKRVLAERGKSPVEIEKLRTDEVESLKAKLLEAGKKVSESKSEQDRQAALTQRGEIAGQLRQAQEDLALAKISKAGARVEKTQELLRLEEQLARKQAANDLAQMTAQGKIDELLRRRAVQEAILNKQWEEGKSAETLRAAIAIEDIDTEFEKAAKELEGKGGRMAAARSAGLNPLQQMGAFGGGGMELGALNIAGQSHEQLKLIHATLKRIETHRKGHHAEF